MGGASSDLPTQTGFALLLAAAQWMPQATVADTAKCHARLLTAGITSTPSEAVALLRDPAGATLAARCGSGHAIDPAKGDMPPRGPALILESARGRDATTCTATSKHS